MELLERPDGATGPVGRTFCLHEQQPVQVQYQPDAQLAWIVLLQVVEGLGVPGELRSTPVPEALRGTRHEFRDPGPADNHTLIRVRRGHRLDARLFSK